MKVQFSIVRSVFAVFILTLSGILPAFAQWTPIKSMGTGPNDGCFSFSLNGKGYVGGGSNNSNFYEYDTATNTWSLKGSAPGNKKRAFGFSFVANGKGYAGTGDSTGGNNLTADVWEYEPAGGGWTRKHDFPGGARVGEFCFVINNIAYIGGGYDTAFSTYYDFYKYDPSTDIWTPLDTLPFGPIDFTANFVVNNKGYVATGANSAFTEEKKLWEYDPTTNKWTRKADLPGAARQAAFGFSLGNYGYVGAGTAGATTVFTDMWRYNPAVDSWKAAPAYPSHYDGWTASFTIGNTVYVGTGSYYTTTTIHGTDSFRKFSDPTIVTGISNLIADDGILVYPNPAREIIHLAQKSTQLHQRLCVGVYDVSGKLWLRRETNNGAISFDVRELPTGIYIVKTTDDESTSQQLISICH